MKELTLYSDGNQNETTLILNDENMVIGINYVFYSPIDVSKFMTDLSIQSQVISQVYQPQMPRVYPPHISEQLRLALNPMSPHENVVVSSVATTDSVIVNAQPVRRPNVQTTVYEGGVAVRQAVPSSGLPRPSGRRGCCGGQR